MYIQEGGGGTTAQEVSPLLHQQNWVAGIKVGHKVAS